MGRTISIEEFSTDSIVDLGLSVNWMNWNVGATSIYKRGSEFMLDTITGQIIEKVVMEEDIMEEDIMEEDTVDKCQYNVYDFSPKNQGRCPSNEEFVELVTKCKWERVLVTEGKKGLMEGLLVVGPNNNKIFLPSFCYPHTECYGLDHFECNYLTINSDNKYEAFQCTWSGADTLDPYKKVAKIVPRNDVEEWSEEWFNPEWECMIRLVVDKEK